jgi:hypothetical protein
MNVWAEVVREHGSSKKGRKPKVPEKNIQKAFSKLLLAHCARFNFPGNFKTNNPLLPQLVCRKKWEDNICCIPKKEVGKCIAIATRNICSLSNNKESVPPRVVAASILAIHHGWPTHHRCGRSHKCYLCGFEDGDKMQHIVNCKVVRSAFVKYGVCSLQQYLPQVFLLCDFRHSRGHNIQMSAIIVASFYKLLNKLRHGAPMAESRLMSVVDKYIDDSILNHSNFAYSLVRDRRALLFTSGPRES